jgi:hypothetical protein
MAETSHRGRPLGALNLGGRVGWLTIVLVQVLDEIGALLLDHAACDLERRRQGTVIDRQHQRQHRVFLDLLVAGEAGVGGFHDPGKGFDDLWVS